MIRQGVPQVTMQLWEPDQQGDLGHGLPVRGVLCWAEMVRSSLLTSCSVIGWGLPGKSVVSTWTQQWILKVLQMERVRSLHSWNWTESTFLKGIQVGTSMAATVHPWRHMDSLIHTYLLRVPWTSLSEWKLRGRLVEWSTATPLLQLVSGLKL